MSALRSDQMSPSTMAYTAAGMYGAAGLDGLIGGLLPNHRPVALVPVIAALITLSLLVTVGPRLPRRCLGLAGPLGVGLVAWAVATTPGANDGAGLYALPVLWTTLFFGRRGAAVIVACVAVAQAAALLCLPSGSAYAGRWVDVMASVSAVSLVILVLERRNRTLVGQLAQQATTDDLTGLLNRRGFGDRVGVEVVRARRDDHPLAIAAFDVDHFKRVNDTWGHRIGDRVLRRLAEVLVSESRDIDVVARVGGEEFVVLLPGVDSAGVDAFTRRVRQALADRGPVGLPTVEVSAGFFVDGPGVDITTMLENADAALYQAKRDGRNRTIAYRRQADRGHDRPAAHDDREPAISASEGGGL